MSPSRISDLMRTGVSAARGMNAHHGNQVLQLDYAGEMKPGHKATGDYLDVITLSPGVGFALSTCTLEPSFHMSAVACIRGCIRGSLSHQGIRAAQLAQDLNKVLCELYPISHARSLFYAEFDTASGILLYVNAGGELAIVVRRNGRVLPLDEGGPVLGLTASSSYEAGALRLASGDRVVVVSDGVVRALAEAARKSPENTLIDLVIRHLDASSAEMVEIILEHACCFGPELTADRTVAVATVASQRLPPTRRLTAVDDLCLVA